MYTQSEFILTTMEYVFVLCDGQCCVVLELQEMFSAHSPHVSVVREQWDQLVGA